MQQNPFKRELLKCYKSWIARLLKQSEIKEIYARGVGTDPRVCPHIAKYQEP